jgi:hypothetical protein
MAALATNHIVPAVDSGQEIDELLDFLDLPPNATEETIEDRLVDFLDLPADADMLYITEQMTRRADDYSEVGGSLPDSVIRVFDAMDRWLELWVDAGGFIATRKPDIIIDQSRADDAMLSHNQFIANSKQRFDEIRPKTVQKIVNIDSRFRSDYYTTTSSDYTIVLPYKIVGAISMRLAAYEIPATYYTISNELRNNKFSITGLRMINTITDEAKSFANTFEITVPDGNYFAWYADARAGLILQNTINLAIQQSFKSVMADLLYRQIQEEGVNESAGETVDASNNATPTSLFSGINNLQLYYACNRTTGKSAFVANSTNSNGQPFEWRISNFTINFDGGGELGDSGLDLPTTLGWILGYRLPEYVAETIDSSRTDLGLNISYGLEEAVVLSEGMCDLRGPKYAYVTVEDYNNNAHEHYLGAFSKGTMRSDVLARISTSSFESVLDAGINSNTSEDMTSTVNNTRYYHGPVDIQQLRIGLSDEFGRTLYLNEMDWSMALSFDQIHDVGALV